jgi:hypothetical protein
MSTLLTLLADLYAHVGPGLLLAFALPVLAGVFGVILLQGYKRILARREEATETP